MPKLFTIIILSVLCTAPIVRGDPLGVWYSVADEKANTQAETILKQLFSGNQIFLTPLLHEKVTLGPGLWGNIKGRYYTKNFSLPTKLISVPQQDGGEQVLELASAENPVQKNALGKALKNYLLAKNRYTIRKANKAELEIYWIIKRQQIKEPLFVAENDAHQFVMDIEMVNNSPKIFWIGDFKYVSIKK